MSIVWPTSYRIKSRDWRIRYLPKDAPELEDDGDYLLGSCDTTTHEILICSDQVPSSMADTLWHELTHACFATAPMAGACEDPEDEEENVVLFATEAAFEIIRNAESEWWRAG